MIDVVFDWDRDGWQYYDGRIKKTGIDRNEFLTAGFLGQFKGKTIAVEKAHLAPREKRSKAQIYFPEELERLGLLVKSEGINILALPHPQSYRAHVETGHTVATVREGKNKLETTKDDDARCFYQFYNNHPEITLQRWPIEENIGRKAALLSIKESTNHILNILRPDYDDPLVDQARNILNEKFESIPEDLKLEFEIRRLRSGKRKGIVVFNETRLMTIFSLVFDENGKLRRNPKGQFIGVDTVMRAITQNPYKGSHSGTARSNIMHHWHRNRLEGLPREQWPPIRARLRKCLKTMIKLLRDAGLTIEGHHEATSK